MPIYEKSTNQLLTEFINENCKQGETITKDEIAGWFSQNYPKIKSNRDMSIPFRHQAGIP